MDSPDAVTAGASWRIAGERVLRGSAVVILLWALFVFTSGPVGEVSAAVGRRSMRRDLAAWTVGVGPADVRLDVSTVPDVTTRAWLAALRATGSHVSWAPTGMTALIGAAVTVEPNPDPGGRVRLTVAAPSGSRVVLGDDLGPIDTITASGGGVTMEGPPPVGMAIGGIDGTVIRAAVSDSLLFRHLLVLGRVGWESKFLVRALGEEGWDADVRLTLTPQTRVTEGTPLPLDTGRVAAVFIVGEPTGVDESALLRYVRAGGGLVLLDGAEGKLARLAVGDTGTVTTAREAPSAELVAAPPPVVPLASITSLRPGAAVLERRDGQVAVAIRRIGAGRVEQVGYRDTWRWRLMDGDSGISAHRRWWASRVSAVAYAPAIHQPQPIDADPAPLAAWIDQFGAPTPTAHSAAAPFRHASLPWLFTALLVTLLAEWASRRLRGER